MGKVVQTWLEVNPIEFFPTSFTFSPFYLISRFHGHGASEVFKLQTLLLLFDTIMYPVKLKLCLVTDTELFCDFDMYLIYLKEVV